MKFNPKVSIVIPVYNGSNYLKEAIDSALSQTYDNIEVIVINDGSSDNGKTKNIALSYGDEILYLEKPNGGVASALNIGIENMTGDYFSWLSHDDVYYENKIELQVEFLSKLKDRRSIIYSDFEIINNDSVHKKMVRLPNVESENFRFWITSGSSLHGCTLIIPKICFIKVGKFNETLLTTQDYDLWFRFAEFYKFIRLPEVLVKGRHHDEQVTRRLNRIVIEECNLMLLKFYRALECSADNSIILANSFFRRRMYLASFFVYSDISKHEQWYFNFRKLFYKLKQLQSFFGIIRENRFLLKYI